MAEGTDDMSKITLGRKLASDVSYSAWMFDLTTILDGLDVKGWRGRFLDGEDLDTLEQSEGFPAKNCKKATTAVVKSSGEDPHEVARAMPDSHLFELLAKLEGDFSSQKRSSRFVALISILTTKQKDGETPEGFIRSKNAAFREKLGGRLAAGGVLLASVLMNLRPHYARQVSQLLPKDGLDIKDVEASLEEWDAVRPSSESAGANTAKEVADLGQQSATALEAKGKQVTKVKKENAKPKNKVEKASKGKGEAGKYCNYCKKAGHVEAECFDKHPEGLAAFREARKSSKGGKGDDEEADAAMARGGCIPVDGSANDVDGERLELSTSEDLSVVGAYVSPCSQRGKVSKSSADRLYTPSRVARTTDGKSRVFRRLGLDRVASRVLRSKISREFSARSSLDPASLSGYSSSDVPHPFRKEFIQSAARRCAGASMASTSTDSAAERTSFLVDGGASHNMGGARSLFSDITDIEARPTTADGATSAPALVGFFKPNGLGLVEGLYHPEPKANLLSTEIDASKGGKFVHARDGRTSRDPFGTLRHCGAIGSLPYVAADFTDEAAAHAVTVNSTTNPRQKLSTHRRSAHFRVGGLRCRCTGCAMDKSYGRVAHSKRRPPEYSAMGFLERIGADFCGPFSKVSHSGDKYTIGLLDDYTGRVEVYAIPSKDKRVDALRKYTTEIGKPRKSHSDNEPVLEGTGSSLEVFCRGNNIVASHGAPYGPQMNGKVERWHRSMLDSVRSSLSGVDMGLWDYAARHSAYVCDRLRRNSHKESPYLRRFNRRASSKHPKVFGCLCFAKIHENADKLDREHGPGVFLGYSRGSSSYLVGVRRDDGRAIGDDGLRFSAIENKSVKFFEGVPVHSVGLSKLSNPEELRTRSVSPITAGNFRKRVRPLLGGVVGGSDDNRKRARAGDPSEDLDRASAAPRIGGEHETPPPDVCPEVGVPLSDLGEPSPLPSAGADGVAKSADDFDDGSELRSDEGDVGRVADIPSDGGPSKSPPAPVSRVGDNKSTPAYGVDVEHLVDDESNPFELITNKDGVTIERRPRRGRPAGLTKDKRPRWNKQGRKPNANESALLRQDLPAEIGNLASCDVEDVEDPEDLDEDGQVVAYTVRVSAKGALRGPDSVHWLEADSLERAQLEASNCWRPVEDGEFRPGVDEITPGVVVYTRKRCGRYRARMVALGNHQKASQAAEIFSPTVSHAATRALLVRAAASGHRVGRFDISDAFTRGMLSDRDRIFLRLPKHWPSDPRGDLVRLLRSLYGLRCAPRRWYETYSKHLLETGRSRCPSDPGSFGRGEVVSAMYVDDAFIGAPSAKLVEETTDEILKVFDGKAIPADVDKDGDEVRDILGVRLTFDGLSRYMKLDLRRAIEKLAKRFDVEKGRNISTPCVCSDLGEGSSVDFPIRSLVGGSQYIGTMCRPDCLFAIDRIARNMSRRTSALVTAAMRIVRYLLHSSDIGIGYSPKREKISDETHTKCPRDAGKGRESPSLVGFSDSDFAGCNVSPKSRSGSIIYHRGRPIAWSSRRQSIRAKSTCGAEYVALYDALRLIEGQTFMDWIEENSRAPLLFCDNRSTITVANSTLPTKNAEHFLLRFHHVEEHSENIAYVPTSINKSDPLTKPMGSPLLVFMASASSLDSMTCDPVEMAFAVYSGI